MKFEILFFTLFFTFLFRDFLRKKFLSFLFVSRSNINEYSFFEKLVWAFFWGFLMFLVIRPVSVSCAGLIDFNGFFDWCKDTKLPSLPSLPDVLSSSSSEKTSIRDSKWFYIVLGGFVPIACLSLGFVFGRKTKAPVVERIVVPETGDVTFLGRFPLYRDTETPLMKGLFVSLEADVKTRFFFLDGMISKAKKVSSEHFLEVFKKENYPHIGFILTDAEKRFLFSPEIFSTYLLYKDKSLEDSLDYLQAVFPFKNRQDLASIHQDLVIVRDTVLSDLIGITAVQPEIEKLSVTSGVYLEKLKELSLECQKLDFHEILSKIIENIV